MCNNEQSQEDALSLCFRDVNRRGVRLRVEKSTAKGESLFCEVLIIEGVH